MTCDAVKSIDTVETVRATDVAVTTLAASRPDTTAAQGSETNVLAGDTPASQVTQQDPVVVSDIEDMMIYAKRIDVVDDTTMYKGEAAPGSQDASPVWRVQRILIGADGDVTVQWAGGNGNFDKTWTDRASHTYS